jgi:hypothetical protein
MAQQAQTLHPYGLRTQKMDNSDPTDYLMVNYTKFVPLTIEALKELSNKVKELSSNLNL